MLSVICYSFLFCWCLFMFLSHSFGTGFTFGLINHWYSSVHSCSLCSHARHIWGGECCAGVEPAHFLVFTLLCAVTWHTFRERYPLSCPWFWLADYDCLIEFALWCLMICWSLRTVGSWARKDVVVTVGIFEIDKDNWTDESCYKCEEVIYL